MNKRVIKDKTVTIKKLRMFSFMIGLHGFLWGSASVLFGVVTSISLEREVGFFSILLAIIGGLFWHSSYRSFSSFREMKNFDTVDEYLTHLKKDVSQ